MLMLLALQNCYDWDFKLYFSGLLKHNNFYYDRHFEVKGLFVRVSFIDAYSKNYDHLRIIVRVSYSNWLSGRHKTTINA